MQYEFNTYTTSDGEQEISFLFVEVEKRTVDGENESAWKAYILTEIDYHRYDERRDDSLGSVHRLCEFSSSLKEKVSHFIRENEIPYRSSSIYYICWTKRIRSLETMKEVAKTWAELTSRYVKYGGSFAAFQPRLKERGIISF